jgi:hypothetical protein
MTLDKEKLVKLTSSEIAFLWNTYMNDCMAACLLTHFLDTVTDPEVEPLLRQNLETSQKHLHAIQEIFQSENIVQPIGFSIEEHVIQKTPKLFSDVFYMQYLIHLNKYELVATATAIAIASRKDIRELYTSFLEDAQRLYDKIINLMLQKGIYIRPPHMTYPDKIDYIEEQSFFNGWIGHTRPLLGIEVSNLFHSLLHNHIGKQVCIGFAQVTKDQEISNYFMRGKDLSSKISNDIHNLLQENDVPPATNWDASVTNSTSAPFSDQLMLFIISSLSSIGNASYGSSLAMSMRRDIGLLYQKFIIKSLDYGKDGLNLMIERKWMEQPPHFLDREQLAKDNK